MSGTNVEEQNAEVTPEREPEGQISLMKPAGDSFLANVERAAKLGPRMQQAIMLLCVSHTFPEDWTIFGEGDKARACLASAGAERLIRSLEIEFFDWEKPEKQEWADDKGSAYRYIYRAKARMWGKVIMVQGVFSSREKLLGYVKGEPRPIEDINEGHIMTAAYHVCRGEGIKAMLGLRGLPVAFLDDLFKQMGKDPSKKTTVRHQEGGQGGAPQASVDEAALQQDLWNLCKEMCYGEVVPAKDLLEEISSFQGTDGPVKGKRDPRYLAGRRLTICLDKAKKRYAEWQQGPQTHDNTEGYEPGAEG